jgi:hypothetical protein
MQRLDDVLRENEGDAEVVLVVDKGGKLARLRSRSRRIAWNEESAAELEAVVGTGRARLDAGQVQVPNSAENVAA